MCTVSLYIFVDLDVVFILTIPTEEVSCSSFGHEFACNTPRRVAHNTLVNEVHLVPDSPTRVFHGFRSGARSSQLFLCGHVPDTFFTPVSPTVRCHELMLTCLRAVLLGPLKFRTRTLSNSKTTTLTRLGNTQPKFAQQINGFRTNTLGTLHCA